MPELPDGAFHPGEHRLQASVGAAEELAFYGPRLIRDHLTEQHQQFFRQLPWVLVGSLDADGQPWASLLAGPPGFIDSPDPRHLRLRLTDPEMATMAAAFAPGAPVALLGLEAHTRRRNRANGRVIDGTPDMLEIEIRQSFGNCPKYIVPRRAEWRLPTASGSAGQQAETASAGHSSLADPGRHGAALPGSPLDACLDGPARALIAAADTFFIASAAPGAALAGQPRAMGLDVSHRAGPPGFVQLSDGPGEVELAIPDYPGNRMFNTLGNLVLEPRAGLLFIDYRAGTMLRLAGSAHLDLDPAAAAAVSPLAQRVLRVRIHAAVRGPVPQGLCWRDAAENAT